MLPEPLAKIRFNGLDKTSCEVHWLYTNGLSEGDIVKVYDHASLIDQEVAIAQAVSFAEYVVKAAKGGMVERAQHFLSLPFAEEMRERLQPPVILQREDRLQQIGDELKLSEDALVKALGQILKDYATFLHNQQLSSTEHLWKLSWS